MTAPLVRSDTFIRATRDSGYVGTAHAIAELIDNAIQAHASRVHVLTARQPEDALGMVVAVVDDGTGMTADEMTVALQFGGSSRFGDRNGQGRFGMGLPNASVSQALRVDLYSWSDNQPTHHTWLDIDAVATNRIEGVPVPTFGELPRWLSVVAGSRGTAVVWSRCDRVPFKRPGMLARHLRREFGRIFRRFISDGLHLSINGEPVVASDPLRPEVPLEGPPEVLPQLVFPFHAPLAPDGVSKVVVTFSLLPVQSWSTLPNDLKRSLGISSAPTVSVLRANREIAAGWFLMGEKRRENYDDWWRAEISFEPFLDDLFGVSHTKQGIRPRRELLEAIGPSLETQARTLNRRVRDAFTEVRDSTSASAITAAANHHRLGGTRAVHGRPVDYSLKFAPRDEVDFISMSRNARGIAVVVNTNHAFYRRLYLPLKERHDVTTRELELWLLALARVVSTASNHESALLRRLMTEWSNATAVLLEER